MEFKVIFAGFALHCVLNAVLIGKSVIADNVEEKSSATRAAVIQQQEKTMLQELASGTDELGRLVLETSSEPKRLQLQH